jgi:hypothetical protein
MTELLAAACRQRGQSAPVDFAQHRNAKITKHIRPISQCLLRVPIRTGCKSNAAPRSCANQRRTLA